MTSGKLVSHSNHPVSIVYDGKPLVISPFAAIKNVVKEKVTALPKDIVFVANPPQK